MVWAVFLSCWLFGLRLPALELASRSWSWVILLTWGRLGELTVINIPLGQEFSGGLAAWTQHSQNGGSVLKPGWGRKTLQAACHGKKEKKIEEVRKEKRVITTGT